MFFLRFVLWLIFLVEFSLLAGDDLQKRTEKCYPKETSELIKCIEDANNNIHNTLIDLKGNSFVLNESLPDILPNSDKSITIKNGRIVRSRHLDVLDFSILHISANAHLSLLDMILENGASKDCGGAIFNEGVIDNIENSVITNNFAKIKGGGICNEGVITRIISTNIYNNKTGSDGLGGGIYNNNVIADIKNSSIFDNFATTGGGIYNMHNKSVENISNSTISNNEATLGMGIYNLGIITKIKNSSLVDAIVNGKEGNIDELVSNIIFQILNEGNVIKKASHNFIKDVNGHTINNTLTPDETLDENNLIGLDIILEPLNDNGGFTRTHALPLNSPIIDKGLNPDRLEFDQRNTSFKREEGSGIDIGAFEAKASLKASKGEEKTLPEEKQPKIVNPPEANTTPVIPPVSLGPTVKIPEATDKKKEKPIIIVSDNEAIEKAPKAPKEPVNIPVIKEEKEGGCSQIIGSAQLFNNLMLVLGLWFLRKAKRFKRSL